MQMRALGACGTLAVWLVALGACNNDSAAKDLAIDVAVVHDGPGTERPVFPDGPRREGLVAADKSLVDHPAGADLPTTDQKVAVDKGKPDGGAFCGNSTKLRCDCYGFSTKQNKFIKLAGKGNQVSINPDFKVRIVTAFGQLKVKQVTALPLQCGEWQTVTALGDFTYQLVTISGQEDFTIQYEQSFPGINKVACASCP